MRTPRRTFTAIGQIETSTGGQPTVEQLPDTCVGTVAVPSSPALEARSVDGVLLHRVWSLSDRLVIDFLDDVVVELRERDGAVVFSRRLPADMEEHLLLDHLLPYLLARRGALVLHGGVLMRRERGVVLTGHSGAGKSTLTAFLANQGWTVGGDDAAVVDAGPPPTVQPTYATVRITPQAVKLLGLPDESGVHVAGKRRLDLPAQQTHREPALLSLVARLTPVPAGRAATFERVHGAEALNILLTNAFHVDIGAGPILARVCDGLARVAESSVIGNLAVPRGLNGLAETERVLSDLVEI